MNENYERRLRLYRGAADLWLYGTQVEHARCAAAAVEDDRASRLELNLYVVAVSRLVEVAHKGAKHLKGDAARLLDEAKEAFYKRRPALRDLRNDQEHLNFDDCPEPFGAWYYPQLVMGVGDDGDSRVLFDSRTVQVDVEVLYERIVAVIDAELSHLSEDAAEDEVVTPRA